MTIDKRSKTMQLTKAMHLNYKEKECEQVKDEKNNKRK